MFGIGRANNRTFRSDSAQRNEDYKTFRNVVLHLNPALIADASYEVVKPDAGLSHVDIPGIREDVVPPQRSNARSLKTMVERLAPGTWLVRIHGDGANPFSQRALELGMTISYEFYVLVTPDRTWVWGDHDAYPAYEVWVYRGSTGFPGTKSAVKATLRYWRKEGERVGPFMRDRSN